MKDQISEQRLLKLHPKAQAILRSFIEKCEAKFGITIRISQGLRTDAEQQALYDQGRTKPGKIVTNSKPGQSFHNYGLAIDLVILTGHGVDWEFPYEKLVPIATELGIVWGGSFKSITDKPHFEITFGYSWKELSKMAKVDGYVTI